MRMKALIVAFLFMSIPGSSSMAQQVPSQPTPGGGGILEAMQPTPPGTGKGWWETESGKMATMNRYAKWGLGTLPLAELDLEFCHRIASIFFRVSPERRQTLADQMRNCIELAVR